MTSRRPSPTWRSEARGLGVVWLALLALMAATLIAAYVPLGVGNTVASVAIAVVKAAIVAVWFMQLRRASAIVRMAAGVALCLLAVLLALSGVDYLTRLDEPAPVQAPQQITPLLAPAPAAR